MTETIQDYNLIEHLQEIEKVTDLNGCFFINVKDDIVIESTIPFKVPEKILWEIGVLRDTFRQFSNGINHGDLNELMIEGSKGYILLYDIPPHLLLLALGSDEVNLSYVRLAMIDILKRIREHISQIGDDILKIPGKDFGLLGEREEKIPTVVASEEVAVEEPPPTPAEQPVEATVVEKEVTAPSEAISPQEPEIIAAETEAPEVHPVEQLEQPTIEEEVPATQVSAENLEEVISSLENLELEEKYQTLESIFNMLRDKLEKLTGSELGEILEQLKDAILLNIGTSLALFDLSKAAKELSKVQRELGMDEIQEYNNRIDNWSNRIIKT